MSIRRPEQPVLNPISGTTINTSPEALGLNDGDIVGHVPSVNRDSLSSSKNILMRTVEQAAAKLSSSTSGLNRRTSDSKNRNRRSSDPRRLLSIRKKERDRVSERDQQPTDNQSNVTDQSRTQTKSTLNHMSDDSPFIRPQSPPPSTLVPARIRPPLDVFRGVESMRAGTQTLFQALQAMPWSEDPEADDEGLPPTAIDDDSSDEDEDSGPPLASSIHTLYRPIARSRRKDTPLVPSRTAENINQGYFPMIPSDEENGPVSDYDDDDFELDNTPQFGDRSPSDSVKAGPQSSESTTPETKQKTARQRLAMVRNASFATVRLKRRNRLADKLRDVFGLSSITEVVAELPCWLLRSILLQGYMYLTNSHLCFFAHLPSREDQILKSGSLSKKTQRTKRWVKHWFILKNDVLSWYQSSSDPYFPQGVVDLRYAISCDAVQERGFRIRTNQKVVHLTADSVPSREEWVKAIRKVIFKAQNLGENVKISIPYSAILDVEKSSVLDFSETIEVKVVDGEEQFSVDSYFFAYFQNTLVALEQIRDAVRSYVPPTSSTMLSTDVVQDTTAQRSTMTSPGNANERVQSMPLPERSSYTARLASLLRPFSPDHSSASLPSSSNTSHVDFLHIGKPAPQFTTTVIQSAQAKKVPPLVASPTSMTTSSVNSNATVPSRAMSESIHTYPPSQSHSPATSIIPLPSKDNESVTLWNVPSLIKDTSRRIFSLHSSSTNTSYPSEQHVSEVITTTAPSSNQSGTFYELGFSILETPGAADPVTTEKFRSAFAFDEKETLLGYFPGYLFRLLPNYGRLYISSNFFCFKSTGPLAGKARMILPIYDILAVEKSRAYRFGHHGLVIIIKGHEELFFEFGSKDRRAAFTSLLEQQMEFVREKPERSDSASSSDGSRTARILAELESPSIFEEAEPRPPPETMTDSLPAVMFTSKSSTFLTFKPQESLRFTFLTIGSRGDVQPYIALGKGLINDGHKVKIATHGEFKEWIEAHGIEFGYVGGDPAELMRICIENGTFTVSFFKEGIQKFRGWIDDLLKTSWEACQNTDVLIESPSAMGGIHIAEALKIPYFRAFTMTWTRTRAYPHAFAVPERKMGGGYNYMSYVMFDQVFWRGTAGQINRWRKNVLKLSSTSLDRLEPHKVPFLYNFSPSVVPPPLDWPEWIRVTGYWFLDDAEVSSTKWTPPDDLLKFIDTANELGKKIVYIGFGSIVVSDPDAMTRCVVEAVKQSGIYAILSKGWSDRLSLKKGIDSTEPEIPLPPQIYSISSIPHDWLFQRIHAACHHGGAGTTGASLRAGIPTIIKPFFGDQFFWSDRVEALGIGSSVRKLTVDTLTEALVAATSDEKQVARAKLIGEKIRKENGVATAIEAIYRDLEYAKSLIKPVRMREISEDDEDGTIRDEVDYREPRPLTPDRTGASSAESTNGSGPGAASEDWSVISDQEDKRSSRLGAKRSPSPSKRSQLAAAVFSILPSRN